MFITSTKNLLLTPLFFVMFLSGDDKLNCDSQTYIMHPSSQSVCEWQASRQRRAFQLSIKATIATSRMNSNLKNIHAFQGEKLRLEKTGGHRC